jgi:hypothetical protein
LDELHGQLCSDLDNMADEFREFVTNTLAGLDKMQITQMGGPSLTNTFCRLDISVMADGIRRMRYYVHQVNRNMDAGLWLTKWKPEHAANFSRSLYSSLHNYFWRIGHPLAVRLDPQ